MSNARDLAKLQHAGLDIQASSDILELIQVQNTGGSRSSLIRTIGAAGGSVDFGASGGTASTAVIRTGGSDRMTITSGGSVGIGVSNPFQTLEVAGQSHSQNHRAYEVHSYSNATAASYFNIGPVSVFNNRDRQAVFDATLLYGALTGGAHDWGVWHGRFVCDYAAQNGRTYYPRFSSTGDGNTSYGRMVSNAYFTKPDPYNEYGTFTFSFNSSVDINATLILRPIHAGLGYAANLYY